MASIPPEHEWAKVPKSVLLGLTCAECLRLYCLLDEEQRDDGWPLRGVGPICSQLGWQARTAKKHLGHLVDAGIVAYEPMPGRSWSIVNFRLLHNPARGRRARPQTTEVWVAEPPTRWKQPPNERFLVAQHAKRQLHDALLVDKNAMHDAPSPSSPLSPEVVLASAVGVCECGEATRNGSPFCGACEEF